MSTTTIDTQPKLPIAAALFGIPYTNDTVQAYVRGYHDGQAAEAHSAQARAADDDDDDDDDLTDEESLVYDAITASKRGINARSLARKLKLPIAQVLHAIEVLTDLDLINSDTTD